MNKEIKEKITVSVGDITTHVSQAIVNAANESLLGGGGVDGAIHRAAGPQLLDECRDIGGCPTGEARITKGYLLPADWVIHTVGPIWRGGHRRESDLLGRCYKNCFALARRKKITSLAFPAISTGVYRYPVEDATKIAIDETVLALGTYKDIVQVDFVCFHDEIAMIYQKIIDRHI